MALFFCLHQEWRIEGYAFDLDTLLDGFQGLDPAEVEEVYKRVMNDDVIMVPMLNMNCS